MDFLVKISIRMVIFIHHILIIFQSISEPLEKATFHNGKYFINRKTTIKYIMVTIHC